jgi:hypothetical protein
MVLSTMGRDTGRFPGTGDGNIALTIASTTATEGEVVVCRLE